MRRGWWAGQDLGGTENERTGAGKDPKASEGAEEVSGNTEDGERQTGLGLRGNEEWLEGWSRIWAGRRQRGSGGGNGRIHGMDKAVSTENGG